MGFLFNQTTAPSQTHQIISITIGTIGESSASKTGAGKLIERCTKIAPITYSADCYALLNEVLNLLTESTEHNLL